MENKQNIKDLINKFYPHAKEKLGFDHPVRVIMRQDAENAQQSLGKTAYYDPAEKLIVLYVTDRHPKDVLRSFSHELVHHAQNCRGDLDDLSTDAHYAKDGKGREIEAEAYLLGNGFLVRDYEDSIKYEGANEMKLTKSQLKGIIEQTIEKITEGGGKPDFLDLDNDGDKKEPMKKAAEEKLDEQQIDMASIANVMEELKMLADKLEKAMGGGSGVGSVNLEEEDVDEMHCGGKRDDKSLEEQVPPKPKLPKNWRSLPSDHPSRTAYRKWMKKHGKKSSSKSRTADAKKQIDFMKSLGDKDPIAAATADPKKTADAKKQIAFLKSLGTEDPIAAATADPKKTADAKKQIAFMKGFKLEENNDAWYNSNLFESLVSKWTKEGDK